MPELPEVETIARGLNPELSGKRIASVQVLDPKVLDAPSLALLPLVENASIVKVSRRAKILLLQLQTADNQELLAGFHLKMTGRVLTLPAETEANKHSRLLFDIEGANGAKSRLLFDDMRRFGYCKFIKPQDLHTWSFWAKLGPEPLEINAAQFANCFAGKRGKIKAALLDQALVVGVGNIYADESLFKAGIRPDALVPNIKHADLLRLHTVLVEVLEESIQACGSSIKDYRTAGGEAGAFQNKLQVYGRAGQKCPSCDCLLESSKVAGRSTVFCPKCQK